MSSAASTFSNVDKTIVRRPGSDRVGEASRKAVSKLRRSSNVQNGPTDSWEGEILARHVAAKQRLLISALAVIVATAIAIQFTMSLAAVGIWTLAAFALTGITYVAANKHAETTAEDLDVSRWKMIFLAIQVGQGMLWGALFLTIPMIGSESLFSVVAFASAISIIGMTLLGTYNLRYATLATSLPIAAAVALRLSQDQSMVTMALGLILLASVVFFHHLASVMRSAYTEHLASRAERDELISELEQSQSISDEARRRAEEANLAKSRFLATMSHELRTPLNAIIGFSEMMVKEVMGPMGNEVYKDYATDINTSGSHLLKLINEILDLSRVEAGRYELNETATSLVEAVEDSQQMIRLRADKKGIKLVVQLQQGLPNIWADDRSVRQIILNLMTNAVKFTPNGGTILVKAGWTAGGGQYISVRDNGPGISEEEIPIVLSAFGQGSIAIKSAEAGTGLGLPIVQALVQMHDGHFELKSKLREGTEVIATFPRKRVLEGLSAVPEANQTAADVNARVKRFKQPSAAAA